MHRQRVTAGLDAVIDALPSIRRLVVVGSDDELTYVNDAGNLALRLDEDELDELPEDGTTIRRAGKNPSGERWIEESFRLIDPATGEPGGAVIVHYKPGAAPPTGVEPYRPWLKTVAWSLLQPPDGNALEFKGRVSSGLKSLLPELPIEQFIVVDDRNRIQYANDPNLVDLGFRVDKGEELFGAEQRTSEPVELADGTQGTQVMMPLYSVELDESGERARLGSVLLQYRPDERLNTLVPALRDLDVGSQAYLEPLLISWRQPSSAAA